MRYFLTGAKLGLTRLSEKEVTQEYVDWMNDSEVTRYLVAGKTPTSIEDVKSFIATAQGSSRVTFAIYRLDTNQHIGNAKLDHIDWISRKADFGIMLGDRGSWGQGFGSEATELVTSYGFRVLNLERIYLGVVDVNASAARVYRKLGYQDEGIRRKDQFVDGSWADTLVMGIVRERWREVTPRRVIVLLQARMGSSRLPGKVLKPLAGEPSLARTIERLRDLKLATELRIATSTDSADDSIEAWAREAAVPVTRGSLTDVLERFRAAAVEARADVVVRITADCPMIDPEIVDRVIATYLENEGKVDYVSNVDERTYPDGLDVEVFSFLALDEAARDAVADYDREHVTPYIRRNFRKRSVCQAINLGDLRWTMDHADDYETLNAIFAELHAASPKFRQVDVLKLLVERPELIRTGVRAPLDEPQRRDVLARVEKMIKIEETCR